MVPGAAEPGWMAHAWTADVAATGLVLLLLDSLLPVTDHVARLALDGWWPWAIAVAGFLLLRLFVAGIYSVVSFTVRRLLFERDSKARA